MSYSANEERGGPHLELQGSASAALLVLVAEEGQKTASCRSRIVWNQFSELHKSD